MGEEKKYVWDILKYVWHNSKYVWPIFCPLIKAFRSYPDKLKNEAEFLYNKEGDMWLYFGRLILDE